MLLCLLFVHVYTYKFWKCILRCVGWLFSYVLQSYSSLGFRKKIGREAVKSEASDFSGQNTGLSVLQVHPAEEGSCCQSNVAVGILPLQTGSAQPLICATLKVSSLFSSKSIYKMYSILSLCISKSKIFVQHFISNRHLFGMRAVFVFLSSFWTG